MSDDDKQHEYVPPVARDILDGQRIAAVAAYAEMQRKAYNLQASYDDAMGMLSAMTAERDALREPLAQARMHQIKLEDCIEALKAERDEWKEAAAVRFDCCIELVKVKNERDEWKEAAEVRSDCCIELVKAENERDELRAALALATMQLAQLRAKMEDDGR